MAEIKCEKCGTTYHDGINKNCPECGTPSPSLTNQQIEQSQEQTTSDDNKEPISTKIRKWGGFHTVLGWASFVTMIVLLIIGIIEWWDKEFIIEAYVAAACIYFFTAGVVLKGFAEITLKSELELKDKGVTVE